MHQIPITIEELKAAFDAQEKEPELTITTNLNNITINQGYNTGSADATSDEHTKTTAKQKKRTTRKNKKDN
jgi:hypothetical protein